MRMLVFAILFMGFVLTAAPVIPIPSVRPRVVLVQTYPTSRRGRHRNYYRRRRVDRNSIVIGIPAWQMFS